LRRIGPSDRADTLYLDESITSISRSQCWQTNDTSRGVYCSRPVMIHGCPSPEFHPALIRPNL
jgi:hypothetical protein